MKVHDLSGLVKGLGKNKYILLAAGLALVVMYDAAGIRRAAGKMAVTLNKMMDDIYKPEHTSTGERLKELLGHTPFEVFVGSMWGIFVAWAIHLYLI